MPIARWLTPVALFGGGTMAHADTTLPSVKVASPVPAGKLVITPSGLRYLDLVVGTGKMPEAGQRLTTHYVGLFPDGRKFDSSIERGIPRGDLLAIRRR